MQYKHDDEHCPNCHSESLAMIQRGDDHCLNTETHCMTCNYSTNQIMWHRITMAMERLDPYPLDYVI